MCVCIYIYIYIYVTNGRLSGTYFGAQPAAIALLLQRGADPNEQSAFGSTALLSACYMKVM